MTQPDPRDLINGQPPKFPAVDPRARIEAATPRVLHDLNSFHDWDECAGTGEREHRAQYVAQARTLARMGYTVAPVALLDVAEALDRLMEHFDGPTLMGSCQTCWLPADEPNDQCREHVAREALARLKESR